MRVAGSMAACQESVGTRHASLRAMAPENLTRRFFAAAGNLTGKVDEKEANRSRVFG